MLCIGEKGVYAEDQVDAVEAVDSAVTGASELVVGREKILQPHDRELASASVEVEADEGSLSFIYIQTECCYSQVPTAY